MDLIAKEVRYSPHQQCEWFDKACGCLQVANEQAPQIASIKTMIETEMAAGVLCVLL